MNKEIYKEGQTVMIRFTEVADGEPLKVLTIVEREAPEADRVLFVTLPKGGKAGEGELLNP